MIQYYYPIKFILSSLSVINPYDIKLLLIFSYYYILSRIDTVVSEISEHKNSYLKPIIIK